MDKRLGNYEDAFEVWKKTIMKVIPEGAPHIENTVSAVFMQMQARFQAMRKELKGDAKAR